MDFLFVFQILFFVNKRLVDDSVNLIFLDFMKQSKILNKINMENKSHKIAFLICNFIYNCMYILFLLSFFYPTILTNVLLSPFSNLAYKTIEINAYKQKALIFFNLFVFKCYFYLTNKKHNPLFTSLEVLILNSKKFTFI